MFAVETLGSKQVYANAWIVVREDAIRRSDGSAGIYAVVDGPDIALIIPADGCIWSSSTGARLPGGARGGPVRNRRPATGRQAAGLAARERCEERGLVAGRLTRPARSRSCPCTCGQRRRVFLATGLTHGTPRRDLEEQD